MIKKLALVTGAVSLLFGGCLSSIIPEPAPAATIYRLSVPGEAVRPSPDAVALRLDRPSAPKSLLGQSIVVSPDGQRLASASGAKWSQSIPALIQYSFYDVLSRRQAIEAILPASGARSEYRAHLTLRNFEAQFDQGESAAPLAIVEYTVTVAKSATRDLIGTRTIRKTARAAGPNVSYIVDAQNRANQDALNDIADWIESLEIDS